MFEFTLREYCKAAFGDCDATRSIEALLTSGQARISAGSAGTLAEDYPLKSR